MTDAFLDRASLALAPVKTGAKEIFETMAWPYILATPVMYVLAFYVQVKKALLRLCKINVETNSLVVDGLSINSRRMKEGAARWPALNTCYNFTKGQGPSAFHRLADLWWMRIRNAQAVRNRLIIAKNELRLAIDNAAIGNDDVLILSLAAGTAQGVIEAAADANARGIKTRIMLVDQDESALRYARDLAHIYGVEVQTVEGNVLSFSKIIGSFKADIVEMMGFVDYLRDGLAIALLKKIRLHLGTGGKLLTCHIHPNSESYFLKHVVDWDARMLYRTRDQLEDLLISSGFSTPQIITEPHGIHSVAVATK